MEENPQNQMADAWLAIADHIKDLYRKKHSAQAWYDFVEDCAAKDMTGIDTYKAAVSRLSREN